MHRNFFLNPLKSNMILSTSRLAKKKIDPFVEVKSTKREINTNPLKPETLREKIKNKLIRDIIPIAIGLGLCGYIMYLIKQKRNESSNLDDLNVFNSLNTYNGFFYNFFLIKSF